MHQHHWSLAELENMLPFERDIYILLLSQQIEQQRREAAQAAQA